MARWSLLVVTERYPFPGGDSAFVGDEIEILARHFDRIVVAPQRAVGVPAELPARTELFLGLAEGLSRAESLPRGLVALLREIPSVVATGERRPDGRNLDLADFGKLLHYLRKSRVAERTLSPVLRGMREGEIVAYTFWLNAVTHGLSRLKTGIPGLRLVSRAHGADLYLERHRHGYIPLRIRTLSGMDALCLVTDSTREYMAAKYPQHAGRIHTFGLGTPDYAHGENPAKKAARKPVYLVSCSSVSRVKRVDRIIDALAALGSEALNGFTWVHFGGGPLLRDLEIRAADRLEGIRFRFTGWTEKAKILEFYKENNVACFLSSSESEGGRPVSMMEALCFGIPIVAPKIGGIPEIVNEKNGALFAPGADPVEISRAIFRVLEDPNSEIRTSESRKAWESVCQAEKNYAEFAHFLHGLSSGKGGC